MSGGKGIAIGLVVSTAALLLVGCGYPAAAKPACADAVLKDWSNGSLGADYSQDCYHAAIEALPEDLRSYTSAAEDIERAATAANRADGPVILQQGESSPRQVPASETARVADANGDGLRAFPIAVGLLGAAVILLGAAGVVASVVRRRRPR